MDIIIQWTNLWMIIIHDDLLVSFSEFARRFGVLSLIFLETAFESTTEIQLSLELFDDDKTLLEHLLNVATWAIFGTLPVIAFLLTVDPFPSTNFLHAFDFLPGPYLSFCPPSTSPSSLFSSACPSLASY